MSAIVPLALSPSAAARFLGVSKRTIYNLIAAGSIVAKKGSTSRTARTLVDVDSIRTYYAALPLKDGPEPLFTDDPVPTKRGQRKTRH